MALRLREAWNFGFPAKYKKLNRIRDYIFVTYMIKIRKKDVWSVMWHPALNLHNRALEALEIANDGKNNHGQKQSDCKIVKTALTEEDC